MATNVSNDNSVVEEMPSSGPSWARSIWNVFAKTTNFNDMTTSNPNGVDFESVHGGIHMIVGGHMGPVDYAGFDPIL